VSALAFLDVGFAEMLVCGFVALVLFGGRLPEVMRNLGASYRNFRRGMEDLKREAGVDVRLPNFTQPPPSARPYAPMPAPVRDPAMLPPESTATHAPRPAEATTPSPPPDAPPAAPSRDDDDAPLV
jgi:sec-independent protein translocase protein TatA